MIQQRNPAMTQTLTTPAMPAQDGAAARTVRGLLEPTALRAALLDPTGGSGAPDSGGLLAVLQGSAVLLRELGAPARAHAALDAQADVRRRLAEAASDGYFPLLLNLSVENQDHYKLRHSLQPTLRSARFGLEYR